MTIHETVSFGYIKVVGEPQDTREFKNPHDQKFTELRYGDLEAPLTLKPRHIQLLLCFL